MDKIPANTALIVIDVQQGHDDPRFGRRNNPDAEARIAYSAVYRIWGE